MGEGSNLTPSSPTFIFYLFYYSYFIKHWTWTLNMRFRCLNSSFCTWSSNCTSPVHGKNLSSTCWNVFVPYIFISFSNFVSFLKKMLSLNIKFSFYISWWLKTLCNFSVVLLTASTLIQSCGATWYAQLQPNFWQLVDISLLHRVASMRVK